MKFSLSLVPSATPKRSAEIAKLAETNGLDGIWAVDEIFHRDVWMTLAACAIGTKKIRLGTGVTNIILRDPTLVAQAVGTLAQMAPGRTFCGLSIGDPNRLGLYRFLPPMNELKPFARLRESMAVIRGMLREGKSSYEGQFLKYSSITTTATTKREVPFYLGGMGGPKSFQIAGELGDGVTSAFGCTKKYHQYVLENVAIGAAKANRGKKKVPYAAWEIFCCAPKSDAARDAARHFVTAYLSSIQPKQIELQGVSTETVQPIRDALGRGDAKAAVDLTTDELMDKFSVSGSPDEVVEKIEKDFIAGGVNELVASIVDPEIIGSMLGVKFKNIPGYPENLKLVRNKVFPHIRS